MPLPHTQFELSDCGLACVATVLAYHGRHVPVKELRETAAPGRSGLTAAELSALAATQGLDLEGRKTDFDELRSMPPGTILHWDFTHFVVLERVSRRFVQVVDPTVGRVRVSHDAARRSFTGVALVGSPSASFERRPGARGALYRRYLLLFRRDARLIGAVLGLSLVVRLLALLLPFVSGGLVDSLGLGMRGTLGPAIVLVVAAAASYALAAVTRGWMISTLRRNLDMRLTERFARHLAALPASWLERRPAGDLLSRLRSNATVRELLATNVITGVVDGSFVIAYLTGLLFVAPRPARILLALVALQLTIGLIVRRPVGRLVAANVAAQARVQSYAFQVLAHLPAIKASGLEPSTTERILDLYVDELDFDRRRVRLSSASDGLTQMLQYVAPALIIVIELQQVVAGNATLGRAVATSALATASLVPLAAFVASFTGIQLVAGYLERIEDAMETDAEYEPGTMGDDPPLIGELAVESLRFSYDGAAEPTLDIDSLHVPAGGTLAVVGASGSGKSTLVKLLGGLYEPSRGTVTVDGRPIGDLHPVAFRRQLGVVAQEGYVLPGTIRDNVVMGRKHLTHDDVVRAARVAGLDAEVARLPLGYETVLGDSGVGLSGGQRQRLAIARAVAGRPAMLLLDEATSHLDTVSEAAVFAELARLRVTRVVIAHRMSTIAFADQIVVLDRGRVVERGTYADLLELGGHFAALAGTSKTKEGAA